MRDRLPEQFYPRRLAAKGRTLVGVWPQERCPRLKATVERLLSDISVNLRFEQQASGQVFIRGDLQVELELLCQRCLQPLPLLIEHPVNLLFIDAQSGQIDNSLGSDIFEADATGTVATAEWIADEVMLQIPLVARHEQCEWPVKLTAVDKPISTESAKNPFAELEQLKQLD